MGTAANSGQGSVVNRPIETMPTLATDPNFWEEKHRLLLERNELKDRPKEFIPASRLVKFPVIELGSAFGMFSKYLPSNEVYIGIDSCLSMITWAKEHFPGRTFEQWHTADKRFLETYQGRFRTVCAFQLIEHFPSIEIFMAIAKSLATERLVFSVPRGIPSEKFQLYAGHLIGWKNEKQMQATLEPYGETHFFVGHIGHICGMVVWS